MKTPKELMTSALAVIDHAFESGAQVMAPLFSSGHDSLCACFVASKHPKFDGLVNMIDTGIGAKASRVFAWDACKELGWELAVLKSPATYEQFIRDRGFPGPGRHQWVYNRLKDRGIYKITGRNRGKNVALITGCRSQESVRRMGTVEPLKIGEPSKKRGTINKRRFWVAPCHDWSSEEQRAFMDFHDLPRNPIKMTPIGMSGECFCGAFARPNEIEMIRKYAPDVAQEIDRLTVIAQECGKHAVWGTRPPGKKNKGVVTVKTGPMCNSCDARALAAGIIVDQA